MRAEWFDGSPHNRPPNQKKRRKKRRGANPPEGNINTISPYRLEVPKRMIPKAKKTKKGIKGEEINQTNQTNQNNIHLPPIIFQKESISNSDNGD